MDLFPVVVLFQREDLCLHKAGTILLPWAVVLSLPVARFRWVARYLLEDLYQWVDPFQWVVLVDLKAASVVVQREVPLVAVVEIEEVFLGAVEVAVIAADSPEVVEEAVIEAEAVIVAEVAIVAVVVAEVALPEEAAEALALHEVAAVVVDAAVPGVAQVASDYETNFSNCSETLFHNAPRLLTRLLRPFNFHLVSNSF